MTNLSDELLKELLICEQAVWEALKTGDQAAEDTALTPDFLGVYPDGFAKKSVLVDALTDGPTIAQYTLSDARLQEFGHEHALLAYHAAYRRAGQAEDEAMYVTSIWRRDGSGWVNVFSQDTPVGQAVP